MVGFPEEDSHDGALSGLVSGLIMAFWIGIGSFVSRMQAPTTTIVNSTIHHDASNTTDIMTTVITSVTAKPKPSGLQALYSLSYMWYSAHNSATVVVVGLLVSLLTGPSKERDLTPGTVYPILGMLLFFLPEHYREKLCCVTSLENKPEALNKQPCQNGKKENNMVKVEDKNEQEESKSSQVSCKLVNVEQETAL